MFWRRIRGLGGLYDNPGSPPWTLWLPPIHSGQLKCPQGRSYLASSVCVLMRRMRRPRPNIVPGKGFHQNHSCITAWVITPAHSSQHISQLAASFPVCVCVFFKYFFLSSHVNAASRSAGWAAESEGRTGEMFKRKYDLMGHFWGFPLYFVLKRWRDWVIFQAKGDIHQEVGQLGLKLQVLPRLLKLFTFQSDAVDRGGLSLHVF